MGPDWSMSSQIRASLQRSSRLPCSRQKRGMVASRSTLIQYRLVNLVQCPNVPSILSLPDSSRILDWPYCPSLSPQTVGGRSDLGGEYPAIAYGSVPRWLHVVPASPADSEPGQLLLSLSLFGRIHCRPEEGKRTRSRAQHQVLKRHANSLTRPCSPSGSITRPPPGQSESIVLATPRQPLAGLAATCW